MRTNTKWAMLLCATIFMLLASSCFEGSLRADSGEKIDISAYKRQGYKLIYCNWERIGALTKPGPDHQFTATELSLIAEQLKVELHKTIAPAYIYTYFFTSTPADVYAARRIAGNSEPLLYIFIEHGKISKFDTEPPIDFSKC